MEESFFVIFKYTSDIAMLSILISWKSSNAAKSIPSISTSRTSATMGLNWEWMEPLTTSILILLDIKLFVAVLKTVESKLILSPFGRK